VAQDPSSGQEGVIEQLRPGLKRWLSVHSEWNPVEGHLDESYRLVASVLYHAPNALVLIDPLVPDGLWHPLDAEVKARGAEVIVLTTIGFHVRDRDEVAQRYRANLGGEPDGVRVFSAERGDEVALWLEEPRAVVFGDALIGDQKGGLRYCPWYRSDEGREITRRALLPLLDLPVELVLTSHGEPVLDRGRDALARVLES
jgi:glyoxylase-like metal-dependent hydrolase (beta-lactamase superfamily II)